ncbi:MAG: cell division protein FtsQ/DivIB [Pseudomonadota bacterium]
MWPLRRRRGGLNDPAPSRVAYRATRLWLSPSFRMMITAFLPAGLVVFSAGWYLAQPEQQRLLQSWAREIQASVVARPEFQVRQMAVSGASSALTDEIHRRVNLDFPVSWFHLDKQGVHDRVAALDAVQSVKVSVDLGGDLRIAVTERVPAILWREGAALKILDPDGHRIAFIDRRDGRPDLPLVTGIGADRAVPEALEIVAAAGPVADRVRGLTRRGERRWDLVLDRDQVIRLPETGAVQALQRVLAMDDALDLLGRDIVAVDLRNPDRPTVRLGEEAVEYLRVTRAFQEEFFPQ